MAAAVIVKRTYWCALKADPRTSGRRVSRRRNPQSWHLDKEERSGRVAAPLPMEEAPTVRIPAIVNAEIAAS